MDTKVVEAVFAEVGKAFRVCRFYPTGHPAVQQAMTELTAALPSLAGAGLVELRIGPAGFALGNKPLLPQNPPVQEFAALLYAQGHRAMSLEPGVTADELVSLIRLTAGGTAKPGAPGAPAPARPAFSHIQLEGAVRRPPAGSLRGSAAGAPAPGGADAGPLGGRSTGVFRPNALPPDIEAHRLTAQLETAAPADAAAPLTRLGAVAAELAASRNFAGLAEAVAALARWAGSADAGAAEAARAALASVVTDGTIASMVGLVMELRTAASAREAVLGALGAMGERAVPAMFDAYVAAPDDASRGLWAGAIRAAGAGAVRGLVERGAGERVEAARAAATLLGATGAPATAVPALGTLARHADAGVRRAAAASAARLGGSEAGRLVVAALRDRDAGVRLEAAKGAAALGDRSSGAILLGRLKEESDEAVSLALIDALGRLREPSAVPALADLARESGGMFRRRPLALRLAAIRALASLGTPEALAAVEPFRTDKNPDIRSAAAGPAA